MIRESKSKGYVFYRDFPVEIHVQTVKAMSFDEFKKHFSGIPHKEVYEAITGKKAEEASAITAKKIYGTPRMRDFTESQTRHETTEDNAH